LNDYQNAADSAPTPCEFAHAASRTAPVFKSKFHSLIVRRGHKRSIIALADKLVRTSFVMLKRNEPYRDSGTDYKALSVNATLLAGSRH
jgi:transposase